MSARVAGGEYRAGGVRLIRHAVRVTVHDGFARTEVEEEFYNDTAQVLEGRFQFALPARSSVSRLALWVGTTLVEAEMVERRRAREIFDKIVDDTIRPRDPALLEKNGDELSLRVFPIPARASRRVVLAYDQPLETTATGLRYTYPLGAVPETIDRFSIDVSVRDEGGAPRALETSWSDVVVTRLTDSSRVRSNQVRFAPTRDFVLEYPTRERAGLPVVESGQYFSLRVPVRANARVSSPAHRTVVLDKSASQSERSLSDQRELALSLLGAAPRTRFVVLTCDTACKAYPKHGSALPSVETLQDLREWLAEIEPSGASDVAGALAVALTRQPGGQIVYVGDGRASAGVLEPEAIGRSIGKRPDLRFVGAGPNVDARALDDLAALSGASSSMFSGSAPLDERIRRIVADLGKPVLESPAIELDDGHTEVYPRLIAGQVVDGELFVVGRSGQNRPKTITLTGTVEGSTVRVTHALRWPARGRPKNPLLPRLFAEARIADLDRSSDPASKLEIQRLSRERHVLTRETSLIALESDAMFREFGIARTQKTHRTTKAPMLRMGMTMVRGRMPPEAIQRVMRQNLGRFRACYHRALLKQPRLEGRVVLRFWIDRNGQVADAEDGGSSLKDTDATKCMIEEARSLRFPAPDAVVRVEYPFTLSPDDGPEVQRPQRGPHSVTTRLLEYVDDPPRVEAGDDLWIENTPLSQADELAAFASDRGNRSAIEWSIRRKLAAGRFESAHFAAKLFAERDPDNARALELLAETAVVTGDPQHLLAATSARVELDPKNIMAQATAARVFSWAGEKTRACAHHRALISLPGGHSSFDACASSPSRKVTEREPTRALTVDVECGRARCPSLVAVSSTGMVHSAVIDGTRGRLRVGSLDSDVYRIMVDGGIPGTRVHVTLFGTTTSFPILANGSRTVAAVRS